MAKGKMWFGTFWRGEFIDCPTVGSDLSPRSWGAGGEFLSGGAYEVSAPDAHKEFSLSWSSASAVKAADIMQAYRDGAYSATPGDLFYFHDPLSLLVNILPKRWAQPSLWARSLRPGAVEAPGAGVESRRLPLSAATITAPLAWSSSTPPKAPGPGVLFVPVPAGYALYIAVNQVKNSGSGMSFRQVNSDGTLAAVRTFTGDNIQTVNNSSGTVRGILLYHSGLSNGSSTVTAARAILVRAGDAVPDDFKGLSWKWYAGMGHSGCRFTAPPTYIPTAGVLGGIASYSAIFREVGDWLQ